MAASQPSRMLFPIPVSLAVFSPGKTGKRFWMVVEVPCSVVLPNPSPPGPSPGDVGAYPPFPPTESRSTDPSASYRSLMISILESPPSPIGPVRLVVPPL